MSATAIWWFALDHQTKMASNLGLLRSSHQYTIDRDLEELKDELKATTARHHDELQQLKADVRRLEEEVEKRFGSQERTSTPQKWWWWW
jgi:transposase